MTTSPSGAPSSPPKSEPGGSPRWGLRLVLLTLALAVSGQLTASVAGQLGARHAERHAPAGTSQTARSGEVMALAAALALTDRAAAEAALARLIRETDSEDVARTAAAALIDARAEDWPADHRGAFFRSMAPEALLAAREHALPPSVMLAQAALESGWGRSTLATRYNNFFGMKAGRAAAAAVLLETVEGVGTPARARFRQYESLGASVRDHARLIAGDPRYAAAQDAAGDWRRYAAALAPVYATDPAYAERLVYLVERYELHRLDDLLQAG